MALSFRSHASYCVRCRKTTATSEPRNVVSRNNRRMVRGRCRTCRSTNTKFVSGKVQKGDVVNTLNTITRRVKPIRKTHSDFPLPVEPATTAVKGWCCLHDIRTTTEHCGEFSFTTVVSIHDTRRKVSAPREGGALARAHGAIQFLLYASAA